MNQSRYLMRGWDGVEGEFRFEEDSQKLPLEKPQEVDEACYSLEEPSADLDETPVYYYGGKRITGDYRRNDSCRERSLRSDECSPGTNIARVAEKAFDHGRNDVGFFRTFDPKDSNWHGNPTHRGAGELFPSADQFIPDFDRLLSKDPSEPGEDSSEDVRRMCQQWVEAGHRADQIYDEMNRSPFGGKFYDLAAEDSFDDVSADGSDDDSSWTEEECEAMVETMRLSAHCSEESCKDSQCKLGRNMIVHIESDLESLTMSLPTCRLLSAIIDHSAICDDTSCAVPWCSFFTQHRDLQLCVEEMRAALQRWYRRKQLTQDFEELNVDISDSAEFIQLDPGVDWPCVAHTHMDSEVSIHGQFIRSKHEMKPIPRNGIDFLVTGHFGRYGQLALTAMSTTICPGAMMLNIVQYVSSEDSRDLWRSLIGLKHPNVIRHLWVCVEGNNVTLCRDHSFMDSESLESLVKKVKEPHRIDDLEVLRYVTGLLSATKYLNDNGIFYLRWIASGIQLNYDYTLARLSDFSSAVNSSAIEADEEVVDVVVNSLPPYILPPEIFSGEESFGRIGACTEVWGIGCVIYHTCCHHQVHHSERHLPHETLREMVEKFAPGDHLKSIKSHLMHQILSKIFTNEEERISLPALEELIIQKLNNNGRQPQRIFTKIYSRLDSCE